MNIDYLEDPPLDGVRNMAVDEALLESGRPVFRFYRWSETTVSLGYFQRYAERNAHSPSCLAPVVRRRSGGGAIVHDRELTYSLTLPHDSPLAAKRLALYEAVHRSFIAALSRLGITAELYGAEQGIKDAFLCFQRFSVGDVVVRHGGGTTKILGSAQYRNGTGSVLQHGSLLLDHSVAAPELNGIMQFSDSIPPVEELIDALKSRLADDFFWNFQSFVPGTLEKTVAFLEETRYARRDWTCRK